MILEIKLALRNLGRRARRSLTLLIILSSAIFLFFAGNAVFDGTSAGIGESFIKSFTGDLVIRAKDIETFSLFGNETPVLGELAALPELAPYRELTEYLRSVPALDRMTPQTSGYSNIEFPGYRVPAFLFGIAGESYFEALDGIRVMRGRPLAGGERGILISEARASEIEKRTGRFPELGGMVQLSIATESSFRIRAVPLIGIIQYSLENPTLDRIVLVDAGTMRSLYGMGAATAPAGAAPAEAVSLLQSGLDELFASAATDSRTEGAGLDRSGIEVELSKRAAPTVADPSAGPWNFLILRVGSAAKADAIKGEMNREFAKRGWPVEAIGWREAAGSSALFVYWLRIIFNVGVIVVAVAGLIVVVNALAGGVLERTGEIGTMRAIGAQRGFIRRLFALETIIIALAAGFIGTILGMVVVGLLGRRGVPISNSFLVQLFGGTRIRPVYGALSALRALGASLLMGGCAWIYPVKLALAVEPVEAMRRQE